MTYAPDDLMAVRSLVLSALRLDGNAVGIVGDASHYGGYHCGADRVVSGDYSVVESTRDAHPTLAAAALDVGYYPGLRAMSVALVGACQRGDPRARDIREVIYSPDGATVRRWDRLGIRISGDDSHLSHTHISCFRDAEGRRAGSDNLGGLLSALIEGENVDPKVEQSLGVALTYPYDGMHGVDPRAWLPRAVEAPLRTLLSWRATVDERLGRIEQDVAAPVQVQVDEAQIQATVSTAIAGALADPTVVAAIAQAVADEQARRMVA